MSDIIEIKKEMELSQNDETVILEAGDKIKVFPKESLKEEHWANNFEDYIDALEEEGMPIIVSMTYEEWDEEALELGDTDERGFIFEDAVYTAEELFYEFKDEGFTTPSRYPVSLEGDSAEDIWVSNIEDENFESGNIIVKSLHFSTKNKDPRAKDLWLKLLIYFEE